jgi:two-component system NarL family response regulator
MEANTTAEGPLRILIADDHPVVREGLSALLNRREDMTVVAEASNGYQAVELYCEHLPDVALLDLRMPKLSGVEAIVEIRKKHPASRLIVLTTFDSDEDIFRALQAGAKAFVLKDTPVNILLDCIRTVHRGQTFIPQEIAAKLAHHLSIPTLTARELQVLGVLAEGKSNKEIAQALGITEGTVKSHLNSIMQKLDADDRTQAVVIALKQGILQLD